MCVLKWKMILLIPVNHFRNVFYAHRAMHNELNLFSVQLYPDNFAKREMLDQDVLCRMKKRYNCTWKGKLGKLEVLGLYEHKFLW